MQLLVLQVLRELMCVSSSRAASRSSRRADVCALQRAQYGERAADDAAGRL